RARTPRVLDRPDGRPDGGALRGSRERALVEQLGPLGAEALQEARKRTAAAGLAHAPRKVEVAGDAQDRGTQRVGLPGRAGHAGLAVANELTESADRRRNHRP